MNNMSQQLDQLEEELYETGLDLPTSVEDVEIVTKSGREEDEEATREALRNAYETIREYLGRYGIKYVLPRKLIVSDIFDGPPQKLYTTRGIVNLPALSGIMGAYLEHQDQDILYLNKAYLEGGTDVEECIGDYRRAAEICREIAEDENEYYGARLEATKLYRGYRSALVSIQGWSTEDIIIHELTHAILVALGIFSPLDEITRRQQGDPTARVHTYVEEGTVVLADEQITGKEIIKEGHDYYEPKIFMRQLYLEKYGTDDVGKIISDVYNTGINACKSFGRELRRKAREKLFQSMQQQAYGAYA